MSGNARAPASKKRNEAAFCAANAEIAQLRSQAAAGHMVLGYLDEAGFSCVHPNRSAWTKVATQHLIPAVRGQRLNVLGALMSTGHLDEYAVYRQHDLGVAARIPG